MKNTVKKRITIMAASQLTILLAVLVEWLAGSACISPQVVKEVQTAKPLDPKQKQISISGGLTDAIIETHAAAFPANPNADINVLVRKGKEKNKEIQLPINLSFRLGPGWDMDEAGEETPLAWSFIAVHAATGVFFKRSKQLTMNTFQDTINNSTGSLNSPIYPAQDFWTRTLYKAWVFGPTAGMLISGTYPYAEAAVGRDEEGNYFTPNANPFISPFVGVYARFIHEKRKTGYIRLRGFLASINYFPLDIPLAYEYGPALPLGIETFAGVFVGSQRSKFISSFTVGLGTNRITMPRLVVGFTFGSKGRLL